MHPAVSKIAQNPVTMGQARNYFGRKMGCPSGYQLVRDPVTGVEQCIKPQDNVGYSTDRANNATFSQFGYEDYGDS